MTEIALTPATPADLEALLPLVAAYHAFEAIEQAPELRARALAALLADPALGAAWFLERDGARLGYLAVCFGYSIEFGGRDAFLDELYLVPEARGQGLGTAALRLLQPLLRARGVVALHLEVARDNARAIALYEKLGFAGRGKYQLMSALLAERAAGGAREP